MVVLVAQAGAGAVLILLLAVLVVMVFLHKEIVAVMELLQHRVAGAVGLVLLEQMPMVVAVRVVQATHQALLVLPLLTVVVAVEQEILLEVLVDQVVVVKVGLETLALVKPQEQQILVVVAAAMVDTAQLALQVQAVQEL
jgi:hypothetical protein